MTKTRHSTHPKIPPKSTPKLPSFSPSESQIQMSFVDYVNKVHPDLRDAIIKIDNEGKTSWRLGKIKKREGKCKGAADLFIAIPNRYHNGLWLEFKTKAGKVTKEQREFGIIQSARKYAYTVVRSTDEAMAVFEDYLKDGMFVWC